MAAAALFSTGGAAIKSTAFSAWQVAGLRSLVAGLFLLACVPGVRKAISWRGLPVALSYAATLTLFVTANKLTTAANAIFLQSTAPLYVLLLAPLLLAERPRRADLLFMGALAGGLALVLSASEVPRMSAPDPDRGDLLGLVAGVCWALTLVGLRAQGLRPGGDRLGPVVLGNLLAAAVCLPLGGLPTSAAVSDVLVILYLGAVQIGVAYLLLARGLGSLPALEASLLLLVEPALAPIWAFMVQGEQPALLALVGGGLILGATGIRTACQRRARLKAHIS